MFRTTVSAIRDYWSCPQRWYLKHVYPKKSPIGSSTALTTGTIWHQFLENLLNGMDRNEALVKMETDFEVASYNTENAFRAADLNKDCDKLMTAGELWDIDWLPAKTLAIEKPLKLIVEPNEFGSNLPIRPFQLDGKPDRNVRLESDQIAHNQHKTRGGSKPVACFLDTYQRSPHEAAYWFILLKEYGEELFGTILDILFKMSPKTIREQPKRALQVHPIPISRNQATRSMQNICRTINNMQKTLMEDGTPFSAFQYNNPDLDRGPYDNVVDPYYDFLATGDWSLFDDETKWKTTEDRYASQESEE